MLSKAGDVKLKINDMKFFLNRMLKSVKLTDSHVNNFEAPILKISANPKILLLTQLWEPDGEDIKGNIELQEERDFINKSRTDTIRLLKVGGIFPSFQKP